MKRLVVCADGTWDVPDNKSGDSVAPSNVVKMALSVRRRDDRGVEQVVYYHKGLGTGMWDRFRGGTFGYGISRHIKDAYGFLIDSYEEGDEIYLFGFSRGAYTVRSLAGLVRNSGILRRDERGRLDEAFDLYRRRDDASSPRAIESRVFRRMYSCGEPAVKFIGVWDTVGSLGIPNGIPWLPVTWIQYVNRRWQFHDTDLSSTVRYAYHALAIDERRVPFAPTLWTQRPDARGQTLEQVWFAGVHCDVGGGYSERGLSDIALWWMMRKARAADLALDLAGLPTELRPVGDPLGQLHDSHTGWYRPLLARYRPIDPPARRRTVTRRTRVEHLLGGLAGLVRRRRSRPTPGDRETGPTRECVGRSALVRREHDPSYRPPNLEKYLERRSHAPGSAPMTNDPVALRVRSVGGPTALIELGGLRFLTDPTFDPAGDYPIGTRVLTKTAPPAFGPEELGRVDAVLLSHDQHPDNFDRLGREVALRAPLVLSTAAAEGRIGAPVRALPAWEHVDLPRPGGGSVRVTAVPAQHGPDGSEHLVGEVTGFVLGGDGLPTIYVSGDNASLAVVRAIAGSVGRIDVAILFAGRARTALLGEANLTLSSEDAAEAAAILGAADVVPLHFEQWAHFTQGADTLRAAFARAGGAGRLHLLGPGEQVEL